MPLITNKSVENNLHNTGTLSQTQYMKLSSSSYLSYVRESTNVVISITNIDTSPHNFSVIITTSDPYLTFSFSGELIISKTIGDGLYGFMIPVIFENIVFNRTIEFSFDLIANLARGVVYALSSFTVHLQVDGNLVEEHNAQILTTQSYEQIAKYEMNTTGWLTPFIKYSVTENPMLASSGSTLTFMINNSDALPHDYNLILLDRVGSLRVFEGDQEYQPVPEYLGNKFTIPVGDVYIYDSIPLTLSVSQISGCQWSRHMVDISVQVDKTNYTSCTIGLDVGNNPARDIQIEGITFTQLDDDTIEVKMNVDGADPDTGLFGLTFAEIEKVAVFGWAGRKLVTTLITKVGFARIFEGYPSGLLEAAVVGWAIDTGIAFIIKGITDMPTDPGLATIELAIGFSLVAGVVIFLYLKYVHDKY